MTRILTALQSRAHAAYLLLVQKSHSVKQLARKLKVKEYAVPTIITEVRKQGHDVWLVTGNTYMLADEEADRYTRRNEGWTR